MQRTAGAKTTWYMRHICWLLVDHTQVVCHVQNGFRGEFLGPQEFGDAVATAVRTLPRSMPVAVLSIPPIGEDLDSVSNATVRQYASIAYLELGGFICVIPFVQ